MNVMVLDRATQAERLSFAIGGFQNTIKAADTQATKQKKIDKILDKILDDQKYLSDTNTQFAEMLAFFTEALWYSNPEPGLLDKIKETAVIMHSVAKKMHVLYSLINAFFYKHKVSRVSLLQYREYANQLEEIASDLENRFFLLPADDEFMDIMQQLEDL